MRMEAFLIKAAKLAFPRYSCVAIRRESDRTDCGTEFLSKLLFESGFLLPPKFKLPSRIGNGLIKIPNLHALAFADHAHRLVMRDGATEAIIEVFKTLLGDTHLLLVEAFFLHLMQVCDHLGLLLSSQGVDLFGDLGDIHIL